MTRLPDLRRISSFALCAALLALAVALAGLSASADGDIYWHLAAGRLIWGEASLLYTDPFSSGAAGRPWTDVHWLFQLGAYAVHAAGGLRALVVVKAAFVACGALLLLVTVRARGGERTALGFAALFAWLLFFTREFLLLRPVIVTLLLLAVFFFTLERFRRDPRWVTLAPLPLCQIAWSNLQGLAPLGVALVLAYGLGFALDARFGARSWYPFARETRREAVAPARRKLLVVSVLVALGSAVTPYGVSALALPWRLLGRLVPVADNVYSREIIENLPPLALDPALNAQFAHLKWFLSLSLLALWLARRRLLLSQLCLFGGLVALALLANRNVLLLYWLGAPIVALWFARPLRRLSLLVRAAPRRSAAVWLGRAVLVAAVALSGVAVAREPSLAEPAPFRVPVKSAELMRSLPPGSVFAADHYGGYLIWKLYPEQRPYLDTRLVLRTAEELQEFLSVVDAPERFDAFERRHGFGAVVLPTAYPDRYLPLIAHLYRSPRYRLVYSDGSETLFVRRAAGDGPGLDLGDPASGERILAELGQRFAAQPRVAAAARRALATLELTLLEFDAADRALEGDASLEAESLRARARLARGDFADAEHRARALVQRAPDDVRSLNLLALSSLERGERDQALRRLRRAARAAPFDHETETILQNLEESRHVPQP